MSEPNPFTPTFGVTPPVLVGRQSIIREADEAIADGLGAPGRAMLITGARGTGKTVTLNAIEDQARNHGWIVITEDARPGLLERLFSALARQIETLNGATQTRLTGLSLPGGLGGFTIDTAARYPYTPGVRELLVNLTDATAPDDGGVMITIDEIHASSLEDLRQFAGIAQHMVREGRPFAFAGAGLPASISDVLNDSVLTYLRRADRHHLGPMNKLDAADAISIPIEQRGRSIEPAALNAAVDASDGYPFFLQLVGHRMWRYAGDSDTITVEHASRAIPEASTRLGDLVHAPAVHALSPTDRRYLQAMAMDDGVSTSANIASRLGMTPQNVGQYRARLIDEGMIEPAGHGRVTFTAPLLREYIREQLTDD